MRRIAFGFLAVIGGLVVLTGLTGVGVFLWIKLAAPGVPPDTILTLEITGTLPDAPPDKSLANLLAGKQQTLGDVLGALGRGAVGGAGADPRVKGLALRIGGGALNLAQVQELRDAIRDFRVKGKPAFAFSARDGEFESGTRACYIAS